MLILIASTLRVERSRRRTAHARGTPIRIINNTSRSRDGVNRCELTFIKAKYGGRSQQQWFVHELALLADIDVMVILSADNDTAGDSESRNGNKSFL